MPRLRDALTVVAAGVALGMLGAGTAAATPATDCPPPPEQECEAPPMHGCHSGIHLDGLLDGLLGGILGGHGACCAAEPD